MTTPSGSRRPHTKTKNGCKQCKKRRVKCDLQPPECSNCRRRGEKCEYGPLQHVPHFHQFVVRDLQPTAASSIMTHFRGKTSSAMSWTEDRHWLWQTVVPQYAETATYLKHGILALSSLHIAHLAPEHRKRYYTAACEQYLQASHTFREITAVNEDNCVSLLTFALVVAIFQLCISRHPFRKDQPFEPFPVLHSLRAGMRFAGGKLVHFIRRGKLRDFFDDAAARGVLPLSESTVTTLENLNKIGLMMSQDATPPPGCIYALEVLKGSLQAFPARPQHWYNLSFWPTNFSAEYLATLQTRHPAALAIFLYWCVYVEKTPKVYYLEGWGREAAIWAMSGLGAEWDEILTWPRQELQLTPEEDMMSSSSSDKIGRKVLVNSGIAGQVLGDLPTSSGPVLKEASGSLRTAT